MTDQCKHCLVRGDWEKRNAESCFHHENWYSVELRKALALKEAECAEANKRAGDRWKLYDAERQNHNITKTELADLREGAEDYHKALKALEGKLSILRKQNAGLRERVKELEEMPIVCPVHKEKLEELESEIEDLKRELNKCDCGICNWCNGDTYYHIKRKLRAKEHDFQLLSSLYSEPIHLGMFYNEEEGIKTIYILDKDGNETDRVVKAECLLKRIAGYFNRAKRAEAQLEEARKALEHDRIGWMIERAEQGQLWATWWCGVDIDGIIKFTQDPNAAVVFPNAESAAFTKDMLSKLFPYKMMIITEHAWCNMPLKQAALAGKEK